MAFLEGLSARDLGTFINGEHFAATQDMTEEFGQEITWRGGFGSDGPILRTIRSSDENTIRFSAVLLRAGVEAGLNDETFLRSIRDFEIQTRRGSLVQTYRGCNWRRISVNSTLDQVTLDCDISIPGFVR
jgi:hypothetical protein